jgi:phage baseplate assembly protein gpV
MDALVNRIRLEVRRVLRNRADPRMGRITSYDPAAHSVKVAILPEADFPLNPGEVDESGWIPLAPICAGNGWGFYAPPAIGTQVMVNHQESHAGAGVAIASINDANNPAPHVPAGEMWMVHASGSFIKLTTDQKMAINGQLEVDFTSPTIKITASTAVSVFAPRVDIGASGGRAVARIGDTVSGGVITSGSSSVFAA